jgi:hypothetical protein
MFDLISFDGSSLVISTPWLLRLLALFSYDRKIVIDPESEKVTIFNQIFYMSSSKIIPFTDCWYIDYEYTSTSTKHGNTDYYPISLVTRNDEKISLCTIKGEDSSHLLLGVHLSTGSDDESRDLVNVIAKLINIPIGKPIAEDMDKKECCGCGRSITAITRKCLYCGAVQE